MEYRNFGIAGVKVSPICLGVAFRGRPDKAIQRATIERAIDHGVNFIDCANTYQRGESLNASSLPPKASPSVRDRSSAKLTSRTYICSISSSLPAALTLLHGRYVRGCGLATVAILPLLAHR